jgi:D-alanyl-lipoteichoic acid acyltransferase DltB (MBOAT superfamily)
LKISKSIRRIKEMCKSSQKINPKSKIGNSISCQSQWHCQYSRWISDCLYFNVHLMRNLHWNNLFQYKKESSISVKFPDNFLWVMIFWHPFDDNFVDNLVFLTSYWLKTMEREKERERKLSKSCQKVVVKILLLIFYLCLKIKCISGGGGW